jgi:hypothetical protein
MHTVLIIDPDAEQYHHRLSVSVPDCRIIVQQNQDQACSFFLRHPGLPFIGIVPHRMNDVIGADGDAQSTSVTGLCIDVPAVFHAQDLLLDESDDPWDVPAFTGTVAGYYRSLCLHHHTAHNTYYFPGNTMDNQRGSIPSGNRGNQRGSRTYNNKRNQMNSRHRYCS